jgi:hypothetical protein
VAKSAAAAAALLAAALRPDAPWRAVLGHPADPEVEIRASLPGVSKEVLAFYRSAGLPLIRDDVLMQLDQEPRNALGVGDSSGLGAYPGHPEDVYAWLAPMCF